MAETRNNERPNVVVPNPDPSDLTSQAIDRAVSNSESRIMARIDGMKEAVEVYHADLTRVPTTVDRAILGLRELLEVRLHCMEDDVKGVHAFLDTRGRDIQEQISHLRDLTFSEIGKVAELTSERTVGATAITNEQIKSLSDVTTQQFKSIVDTFAEKDKAVSVGLSAQKESAAAQQASNTEATNKMEGNFTKLLDQGRELLTEVRRNTELQINDLKANYGTLAARLDKGEGRTSVSDPATAEALKMLATAVGSLGTSRDMGAGAKANTTSIIAMVVAAVAVAGFMFTVVGGGRQNGGGLASQGNDLTLGRLVEMNTQMIQRLEGRLPKQ